MAHTTRSSQLDPKIVYMALVCNQKCTIERIFSNNALYIHLSVKEDSLCILLVLNCLDLFCCYGYDQEQWKNNCPKTLRGSPLILCYKIFAQLNESWEFEKMEW